LSSPYLSSDIQFILSINSVVLHMYKSIENHLIPIFWLHKLNLHTLALIITIYGIHQNSKDAHKEMITYVINAR